MGTSPRAVRVALVVVLSSVVAAFAGACDRPIDRTEPAAASPDPAPPATPAAEPAEPPSPTPAPSADSADADPDRACARDEDCVLVTGGCAGPWAVNRASAPRVHRERERVMSVAECARGPEGPHAWSPLCSAGRCIVSEGSLPELRACAADSACMSAPFGCQWVAIARAHEAELRRRDASGDACPGILAQPPSAVCMYGACVFGSEDVDAACEVDADCNVIVDSCGVTAVNDRRLAAVRADHRERACEPARGARPRVTCVDHRCTPES